MKNWKNRIGLIGIVLLCLFACAIPSVLAEYEDRKLQMKTKTFQIEEIHLNSMDINIEESLRAFCELKNGYVVVEDKQESLEENHEYEEVKGIVKEFLDMFDESIYPSLEMFYISWIGISDVDFEKLYPLWKCHVVEADQLEYWFLIDAVNEKIIAFDIPISLTLVTETELNVESEKLADYYGLTFAGFDLSAEKFLKKEYWDDNLWFVQEDGEKFLLPIYKNKVRVGFNMYMWEISTDAQSIAVYP